MSHYATAFAALILEALPFLLLGATLSGILEVFLPQGILAQKVPKHPLPSALCGLFIGLLIPTCECGSVPVVKKLLSKGAPPSMAFAYLLAATVVNPMVLFSTWIAFPNKPWMVLLRAGFSLLIASITTTVLIKKIPSFAYFPITLSNTTSESTGCSCGHCHTTFKGPRWIQVLHHARHEFTSLFSYLVLGAAIAAASKTFLPDSIWLFISDHPLVAIPGLMFFAFALSLCSEADAFVAAALSGVSSAAQLAFLALGPVLDIKLLLMYRKTFSPAVVKILVILPVSIILIVSVILSWILP